MKILVVDDQTDVRETMADVLSHDGFTVETAVNGQQALLKIQAGEHFDAMLLDMALPLVSGHELLQTLDGCLPTIVLSGRLDGDEQGLPGVVAVFTKPADPVALAEEIRKIERGIA